MAARYTEYGDREAIRLADEAIMDRIVRDFRKWHEDALVSSSMLTLNKRIVVESLSEVWLSFVDEVQPVADLIHKEG